MFNCCPNVMLTLETQTCIINLIIQVQIPSSTDSATYGASMLLQKRIQSEIRQGSLTYVVQAYVTSEGRVALDPGWRGILSFSCHFGYLTCPFLYNLNQLYQALLNL